MNILVCNYFALKELLIDPQTTQHAHEPHRTPQHHFNPKFKASLNHIWVK